MLLAAAILFNPLGLGFFRDAFFSNEALTRNIAQPIWFAVAAILLLIVLLEGLVRMLLLRRRARGTTTA